MSQEALTVRKPRALEVMAERLNLEPTKLFETLKATVFKGASNEEMAALVVVSNEYHLNPLLRELYAFPAKGGGIVPLIPLDGWTKIVNRQPAFDGVKFHWDFDAETNKPIACTCTMWVKGRREPVEVTEFLDECSRATEPWTKMPRRMLRHKAFIQAARLAFGLSGLVDEDEAPDVQVMRSRPIRADVDEPKALVAPPLESEKELADAGLAPVAERQITPQDKLMIYLQDFDITIDGFAKWAVNAGHLEQSPATWYDVPAELATKLWPARKKLANEIQAQCKS